MPDDQQNPSGQWINIGNWLVTKFGPTDALLIVIMAFLLGIIMGWIHSPMLQKMNSISAKVSQLCARHCPPGDDTCREKCWQP